ncbi:MAG: hypothetical protein H0X24_05015 [Ktedonobacterales bacterium]|nr:hypothetical protein [Ktedonobacterales bacterium]
MSLYEQLDRYRATLRCLLICTEALPELATWHTQWQSLPGGRPDGLTREARYMLAIYRAALNEQTTLREWLVRNRAEAWLAAAEAEATLLWQLERRALDDDLQPRTVALPPAAEMRDWQAAA